MSSQYFLTFILHLLVTTQVKGYLYSYTGEEVLNVVEKACFIAGSQVELGHLFDSLTQVFEEDENVEFGFIDVNKFKWPSKESLVFSDELHDGILKKNLILFKRVKKDRTCLLTPKNVLKTPEYVIHSGQMTLEIVTSFINEYCGTFRQAPDGRLSIAGLHHKEILENVFYVSNATDVTMKMLYQSAYNPLNESFTWIELSEVHESCPTESNACTEEPKLPNPPLREYDKYSKNTEKSSPIMARCERLKIPPTQEEFFHEYVKKSRPFILENATNHWPAFTKWSNQFLRDKFGNKTVHVKMTPSGDYEGVESANIWENFERFKIPETVMHQLKYPDLVVVRPAGVNMNFSEFIDLIERTANIRASEKNVSAYLEYTSVADFDVLEEDVIEPAFAQKLLARQHLNIWLSDGDTLGRLHFDPYDNLLCQLAGKKEVIMFDPHDNQNLYEAHIPQAELSFNKITQQFRRKTLQDSTALVMSPVDIRNPDLKRFPKFLDTHPLNCTIYEGDILFMPSFWWHEVKSSPSAKKPRNLAVNFWYKPFLTKEFPCEECPLEVNPFYFDKL